MLLAFTYRRAVKSDEARPGRLVLGQLGDVQSDTTDNTVATVTADLGAGDCLLGCGPVLLNFGSLHDQITVSRASGHLGSVF